MKSDDTSVVKISIEGSIDKKLNNLSSNLYAASIYKVVQKLRKANEAAYSPRLVSIGPLHHGLPLLQGMEAFKLRFLNNFLCRFGIGLNTLVKFAARKESFVRHSATELHQAGVKFSKAEGNCFFNVDFTKEGVLNIPALIVNDTTETFFRNLIAFEQCGYRGYYSEEITSYVILMDSFIDTRHDVDLLDKSGIITNKLGDAQKVADLFNNLHKEVVTEANIFYFDKLCGDLNKYSKNQLHEWKASCFRWRVMLRRDYFSNPWSFISVLAATVLLILTIIQTICSLLQVI